MIVIKIVCIGRKKRQIDQQNRTAPRARSMRSALQVSGGRVDQPGVGAGTIGLKNQNWKTVLDSCLILYILAKQFH